MESQQEPRMRSVVSYVQRGGRMTVGQQRAWQEHWPRLGRSVSSLESGYVDFADWFGRDRPVLLEIGSGMGETTAALAAAEPDVNYVAVEVYSAGLGQLMMRATSLGVENLRLLHGDAVVLLTEHVQPESLAEIRIFFPDPWPKKRHHKRRLIQPDFVRLLASRLAAQGTLHLATDWQHYAEHMLEVCSAEPSLRNQFESWAPRPRWRPVTKFEQRADEEGRISRDLIFTKNESGTENRG